MALQRNSTGRFRGSGRMPRRLPQRVAKTDEVADIVRIMIEDDEAIQIVLTRKPADATRFLIDETVPD
jgi:hypothetical protein